MVTRSVSEGRSGSGDKSENEPKRGRRTSAWCVVTIAILLLYVLSEPPLFFAAAQLGIVFQPPAEAGGPLPGASTADIAVTRFFSVFYLPMGWLEAQSEFFKEANRNYWRFWMDLAAP